MHIVLYIDLSFTRRPHFVLLFSIQQTTTQQTFPPFPLPSLDFHWPPVISIVIVSCVSICCFYFYEPWLFSLFFYWVWVINEPPFLVRVSSSLVLTPSRTISSQQSAAVGIWNLNNTRTCTRIHTRIHTRLPFAFLPVFGKSFSLFFCGHAPLTQKKTYCVVAFTF